MSARLIAAQALVVGTDLASWSFDVAGGCSTSDLPRVTSAAVRAGADDRLRAFSVGDPPEGTRRTHGRRHAGGRVLPVDLVRALRWTDHEVCDTAPAAPGSSSTSPRTAADAGAAWTTAAPTPISAVMSPNEPPGEGRQPDRRFLCRHAANPYDPINNG